MTTGTFFSSRNRQNQKLTTCQTDDWNFFFPVVIARTNLPDRRLELFFPVVIARTKNRQPARQTTGTFFISGRNRQNHNSTTRQTDDWNFFFPGRNRQNQPARQTTGTFFFSGCNWNGALPWKATRWKFGFTNLSIGDTQAHQLGIYPEKESLCFNILNYMP